MRHPFVTYQAAISLQEISNGRFHLGLGVSHKFFLKFFAITYQRPILADDRSATILRGLVDDGEVELAGEIFGAKISALQPRLPLPIYLFHDGEADVDEYAGKVADGVLCAMTSPELSPRRPSRLPSITARRRRVDRPPSRCSSRPRSRPTPPRLSRRWAAGSPSTPASPPTRRSLARSIQARRVREIEHHHPRRDGALRRAGTYRRPPRRLCRRRHEGAPRHAGRYKYHADQLVAYHRLLTTIRADPPVLRSRSGSLVSTSPAAGTRGEIRR